MSETTVRVEAKAWYTSVTTIFNVLAGAAVVADWALGQGFGFVGQPWFAAAVAAINFALRFKTDRPVAAATKFVDVKKAA